jgi:hypothetical protein
MLAFSAIGPPQAANNPCVLVAGTGCGDWVLKKTHRSQMFADQGAEARFAKEGVTFTFDAHDILDSIVATNKKYQTDKFVAAGDNEERVRQIYGKPTKAGKIVLYKGEKEPIGSVGDNSLMYPGILFVIDHGNVWAISIIAKCIAER